MSMSSLPFSAERGCVEPQPLLARGRGPAFERVEAQEHDTSDKKGADISVALKANRGRVDRVLAGSVREVESPVERDSGIGAPLEIRDRGAAKFGAARLRQLLTGSG